MCARADGQRVPAVDYVQEIRFAVVMYGGVSLAIYMNGVSQELMHLVRSTAARQGASGDSGRPLVARPTSTDEIYRRIAQILGRDLDEHDAPPDGPGDSTPAEPIRTRFVIDILSGTSAGGINAIYLAKALARGQDISHTADMWIDEGDIQALINDKGSVRGLAGIKVRKPPPSLLNGDRLFAKLYEAFRKMEAPPEPSRESEQFGQPLVDELDLFVTATDIRGLPLGLDLADGQVWENQHRHVFRFRFDHEDGETLDPGSGTSSNHGDFGPERDPILAFAGRCTSSFPFAFEPVRLDRIRNLLPPGDRHRFTLEDEKLMQRLFPEYLRPTGEGVAGGGPHPDHAFDPTLRSFVDGGYLDNKPFGHAIDALGWRTNELPVERKLLYIEPSPEHPEEKDPVPPDVVPDALDTVVAAFTLPRHETIREEIQRVLERNRLVRRIDNLLGYLDSDLGRISNHQLPYYMDDGDLRVRLERIGVTYFTYHRLKVAALSDEITEVVGSSAGHTADSGAYQELRTVVSEWRSTRFVRPGREVPVGSGKEAETGFLMNYTLSYRVRRLRYVMRIAGRLCLDDAFLRKTLDLLRRNPHQKQQPSLDLDDRRFAEELLRSLRVDRDARRAFRSELRRVRRELAEVLRGLRTMRRGLVIAIGKVSDPIFEGDRTERRRALDEIMERVWRPAMVAASTQARVACESLFEPYSPTGDPEEGLPRAPEGAARWLLWRHYSTYETYDMAAYPLLYATDAEGEVVRISVHRISPEDAIALYNERERRRPKLAGESLGHFGAFLDKGFRRNDVLWGRLDAAERLISILLADGRYQQERVRLIREAHQIILREQFGPRDATAIARSIFTAGHGDEQDPEAAAEAIEAAVRDSLEPERLLEDFKADYAAPSGVDPALAVRSVARATSVLGSMLEEIGDRRAGRRDLGAWIARLGRWLTRLAAVALPGSIPWRFFRHWLGLAYLFEVLLIVVGTALSSEMARIGALALFATAVVHLAWTLLGDYLRRRRHARARRP